MDDNSRNKTKDSKLILFLLVILPALIMAVSQRFLYKLMKHEDLTRHYINDLLRSCFISLIIGFLISIYPATKLARKNQPNDERFDQTVGLAILITLGNVILAWLLRV